MNTPRVALIRWLMVVIVTFGLLGSAAAPLPSALAASQAQDVLPQTSTGETCVLLQPSPSAGVDSYIKQEKQDERRGADSELRVKGDTNKLKRTLLQFDLSALPADAIVSSATLSLYVKSASGGALTVNAHGLTRSWNEAEVTWKAADKAGGVLWTSPGGDYGATVASTVLDDTKNVWRTWSIGSLVVGWKSNPATNFGVLLEATSSNAEKVFKSSDDGTTDQRPKLEVCFSAGLTLTPNNSGEGLAGQAKIYPHVVTLGNLGPVVVSLSASSNRGWTTRIYKDVNGNGVKDPADTQITQTPAIGPNASYPILVEVNIPVGVPLGMLDTTTVQATGGGRTATATDTTRVGQLLTVQPNYTRKAVPGTVQFFGHVVYNNGSTQDCVTITATSSQGWTVRLWQDLNHNGVHETSNPNEPAVSNPVCINPSQAYYLVAEVAVPAGASPGTTDQTVIRVASSAQPGKVSAATDTTTVIANTPPVIDGKYDEVYNVSPDAQVMCYNDTNGTLFGKLATFYQPGGSSGNSVSMVLAIDKDFVDNTYGANAVNWPSGHTYDNLVGSDHAQFLGYDANGALVLDIKVDYISAASGTPSGYDSLGVTGGEGRVNLGNAAHILQWATSEDYNLNNTGYCSGGNCSGGGTNLLVDSPATDEFYTPNPTYPNWIYDVIYEIEIRKTAFGSAGFGSLEVPYIHASPSKLGTNTIYAEPGVCPGEIGDMVWNDVDHDGVQDVGEPGLAGVQVKLYRDDGDLLFDPAKDTVIGTQTTGTSGKYLFQNVPPGDFFAVVVDSTVPAGYIITTNNNPTPVFNLPEGGSYLDADFGYARSWGDYQLSKTLTSGNPANVGSDVTYSIRITNTGATVINFLPLQDMYDPARLQFKSATPAPSSTASGVLTWNDLTASFGQDLGLGQIFVVQITLTALQPTQALASAAALPDGLDAEPVIDGRLDSNYTFVARYNLPAVDTPANLYKYEGANVCYWALVTDRGFNSNVYADKDLDNAYLLQDGWKMKHDFSALLNSDHAIFDITYPGGKYTNLTLDYLAGTPGAWSSGQTGYDQSAAPGTGPVNDVMTSLHGNMLYSGWNGGAWGDPLRHSPPYDYNAVSGKYWEWNIIYEFSIPKSRLGGACGTATLVSAHNSPAKGVVTSSVIGDTVWADANENRSQDAGESGLPGVIVRLYQGGNVVRVTQTEPGNTGYYIFNNLDAGTYVVNVDESTLPANYALTTNNEPMTVTLPSGGAVLTADFGYWLRGSASIGDRVFYDLDGSGLPDGGAEPGINGVTVKLYTGTCAVRGSLWGTLVTAGNGGYNFTNLPAGTYCVDVDQTTVPTGYVLTTANEPLTVTVTTGQAYTTADFGYRVQCPTGAPNLATTQGVLDETGSTLTGRQSLACVDIQAGGRIGDLVWNDANGNGVQDYYTLPGGSPQLEPGIAGAMVALTRPGGSVITATTTITGYYQFIGLGPGQYSVDVIQTPTGYFTTTNNHPQPVNLAAGQSFQNADFGYAGKGLISGVVFYDWNQDGAQGPSEQGISNVPVCLYKDVNRNGLLDAPPDTLVSCQNSGSQGEYVFNNQLAGAYIVKEIPPANLQNTTPTLIPVSLVVVGTAGIAADNNYGHVLFVKLGDFVYVDLNANGQQDPGETLGLAGVPLQLTGTNVVGESVNWTGATGSDGSYLVDGLLPGTYVVTAPSAFNGFHLTSPSAQGTTLDITHPADLDLDFGYVYPTAVSVQQFGALVGRGGVELSWLAFGEPAPLFHVWRADNSKGIGAVQVTVEPVAGVSSAYRFVDAGVAVGQSYWYWLADVASGQQFGPQTVTVRPMVIGAYLPLIGQ